MIPPRTRVCRFTTERIAFVPTPLYVIEAFGSCRRCLLPGDRVASVLDRSGLGRA
jgi:hypothetical protein